MSEPNEPVAHGSSVASVKPRLLTESEVRSVAPIFEAASALLPVPEKSFMVGTVDPNDGHVTGFLTIQLQIHAEPMWIEPGNEHSLMGIIHEAERLLAERTGGCLVYTFAPAGKVARLAQMAGMVQEPWCVFSKIVLPEEPDVIRPVQPN